MQKKLQKYIDLLIEMAGSDNDYETIKEELNEVEKEIEIKKNELKNIKKSMKDDKYLKENDRIIDENIKIGLENKKQVYQYELDKTLKLINKASVDEEDNHQALTSVVSRLKSLNTLLDVLQDKLKVVGKDKELNLFYEITNEVNELEKKKEILTKQYDKVREKLEYFGNNRSELDKKIEHLNIRLEDTLEALSTPNFYVDEFLKKKDESVVDELNSELEALENNRLSLITDPTYIGKEAMKLYSEEDYTSALSSIKELVTIVKSKPYMSEDKKNLNDLLKQAEITLDEFANNMDNNSYLGEDSKIVENRINYLDEESQKLDKEIENIKNRIVDIDKNVVIQISKQLSETEDLYNKLKDDYEEYKKIVLVDDDSISPRKKANLQAAYNNKKEEMDLVYQIFENYQKELEETIMKSQNLETVELASLEKKKEEINEEIDELRKAKSTKNKAKDVLAIEKDKATLNKLSLDVDNIKHSQKYDKTADEIYNEIESLFGNEEDKQVEKEETVLNKEDFVNLNDFKIGDEIVQKPSYDVNPIITDMEDEKEINEPVDNNNNSASSDTFNDITNINEPIILDNNDNEIEPINESNEPVLEQPLFVEVQEPIEPVAPIEPIAPVVPTEPIESVAPVIPNEQMEPIAPVLPIEPIIDNDSIYNNSTFKPDEKILQAADQNLEDTKVFPPRATIINDEERYKVINIEEISNKNEPTVENEKTPDVLSDIESLDEPVINSSNTTKAAVLPPNDSDYISFNDILNGGYNGN